MCGGEGMKLREIWYEMPLLIKICLFLSVVGITCIAFIIFLVINCESDMSMQTPIQILFEDCMR